LPGIWGSLTSDLPREDAGGSSSGTSWYRAGLLRALEARPLPASIAPDAVHHPDSNNDWQTTAQWFEMSGTLVDFFLPGSRIPPPPRGAGGFPRTTGGWAIDRRTKPQPSATSSPRSEPRPPRWL